MTRHQLERPDRGRRRRALARSRDRQDRVAALRRDRARRDDRGPRGRSRRPARPRQAHRRRLRRQHGRGDGPARRQGAVRHRRRSTRWCCRTGSTATRRRSRRSRERTRHADGVVAVGSGVLNDSCKHATFLRRPALCGVRHRRLDERLWRLDRLGDAASPASRPRCPRMRRAASSSTSASRPRRRPGSPPPASATASAARPRRSTGGPRTACSAPSIPTTPYALQAADEAPMIARAGGLGAPRPRGGRHPPARADAVLDRRVLHQRLASRLDGRAPDLALGRHVRRRRIIRGTTHGQQVGVASLVMARIQARILAMEAPPAVRATVVDEAAMLRRYGPELAPLCIAEMRKTALDGAGAEAFNRRLAGLWPTLRPELQAMADAGRDDGGGAEGRRRPDHGGGARPAARRSGTTPSAIRARSAAAGPSSTSPPIPACSTPCWRTSIDASRRRDPGRDLQGPRRRLHRHRRHADDRGSPAGGGLWRAGAPGARRPRGGADHRPPGRLVRHDRALLAGRRRRRRERRLLFPPRCGEPDDGPPLRRRCRASAAPTASASPRLGARILAAVPGAAISADQLYREADLAIDFCEDVEPLPPEAVDRIVALFEAAGAVAKVSSIHVNGWFGAYDKLSMARRFVADVLGLDLDACQGALRLLRRFAERRPDVRLLSLCLRRRQCARLRRAHAIMSRPMSRPRAAARASSRSPTGSYRKGGPEMASVSVRNVRKAYGDVEVVHGIDLSIADGAFIVLLGPSGCGKSTLLRMIAGLEPITSGEIEIGGQTVNDLHPKDRNIAMVFQNYALYAHMTVFDNMAFSMQLKKLPKEEIRTEGRMGRLDPQSRRPISAAIPAQLSGGQRQRVAMGRAIVRDPGGLPVRRALVQPRRQAARADAHRDQGTAPAPEDHDGLRHPRPDRGDDHGRHHRHPARRPYRADRPAARRL